MPFLLLLVLMVACLPGAWPEAPPWLGEAGSALGTWIVAGIMVGAAGLLAWLLRRQLGRDPSQRSVVLRRYRSWRLYHALTLVAVYLFALFVLGWVHTVRDGTLAGRHNFPGVELIILAPFLSALILSWALFYDVERAVHSGDSTRPIPSRWAYVGLQTRVNLILICPPLLLMMAQQAMFLFIPGLDGGWLFSVLSIGMLAAVLVCIPWILRLMLGLESLPAGPLRDRLLAAARRLHFRCNDILLWNTRHGMANAMVTGLLPGLRYVIVTDRLVNELTLDEVEAVFGHEVGHIKHHHPLYYLLFLLASVVVVAGVWGVASALLSAGSHPAAATVARTTPPEAITALPFLAMMGTYVFVVFGFVSRRCERQADIYGCRAVSCATPGCAGHEIDAVLVPRAQGLCPTGIRTFIGALEKVARLNGMSRERPGWLSSWLHSTIARRVQFLEHLAVNPEVERRFQRAVRRVQWGLFLGLGAVVGLLVLGLAWAGVGLDQILIDLQNL
jgi:Zn-dependent protease with chaperone function